MKNPRNNKMKASPPAKVLLASKPIKNTDTPSDKPRGKTMGELGLTPDQMKKAYPWGGGPGYSPSK